MQWIRATLSSVDSVDTRREMVTPPLDDLKII